MSREPINVVVVGLGRVAIESHALSEIISQRIDCLAAVSINVGIGRYRPKVEGPRYLFGEVIEALRGEETYPEALENIRKETDMLESALSDPTEPFEVASAVALPNKQ